MEYLKDVMKLYLLIIMLLGLSGSTMPIKNPELLEYNVLKNPAQVQELLLQHGFKKVCFSTQDHVKLCGLLLDQSATKKIKGTIVYCSGFYPGTKEGMSSFYTLLDEQPYNFLLFDARGHHESEGQLFAYHNLKQYGSYEYLDVIASIHFLNQYNTQHQISPNIIIHGICAGAFHCIKAFDYLQTTACPECANIKAIIFDSGWLELVDIVEPTLCAEIHKRLDNTWFSWLITPLCLITLQWYRFTLKHHHRKVTGITESIKQISCPILFVHNINDPYVPIAPIQTLVLNGKYPNSWWIEHNSHADFHMKKPQEYTIKIVDFLNSLHDTQTN
jgi:hypothetical protein